MGKGESDIVSIGEQWALEVDSGLTLRGRWFDNPGKPVLHFIHGNGFAGGVYWPFLRRLTRDYALLLHDTQGHGDSDNGLRFPGWRLTIERIIQTVHNHCDELFPNRPVIGIGHSFGSVATFLAAAREPGLFKQVLMLDPVLMSPSQLRYASFLQRFGLTRFHPLARQAKVRGSYWDNRAAAWQYFYQRGVFKGWTDKSLNAYIDHALQHAEDGSLSLKCPAWMEAAIFAAIPPGLWRQIKTQQTPTHIFYGDQSYESIAPSVARAEVVNPLITSEVVPGTHCFMQEDPKLAAKLVLEKLSTLGL